MQRIEVTTKPNGAGRNWLEVGYFETDALDRKQWIKKNVPHQDAKLTVDRQYSARGRNHRLDSAHPRKLSLHACQSYLR